VVHSSTGSPTPRPSSLHQLGAVAEGVLLDGQQLHVHGEGGVGGDLPDAPLSVGQVGGQDQLPLPAHAHPSDPLSGRVESSTRHADEGGWARGPHRVCGYLLWIKAALVFCLGDFSRANRCLSQ